MTEGDEDHVEVEIDPLAPVDPDPQPVVILSAGDQIMEDIKKHEPEWLAQRPGARMYDYAVNRMRIIDQRQRVEGSKMMAGWRREYLMMDDVKNLIEWMEQQEIKRDQQRIADEEKAKKRRFGR